MTRVSRLPSPLAWTSTVCCPAASWRWLTRTPLPNRCCTNRPAGVVGAGGAFALGVVQDRQAVGGVVGVAEAAAVGVGQGPAAVRRRRRSS